MTVGPGTPYGGQGGPGWTPPPRGRSRLGLASGAAAGVIALATVVVVIVQSANPSTTGGTAQTVAGAVPPVTTSSTTSTSTSSTSTSETTSTSESTTSTTTTTSSSSSSAPPTTGSLRMGVTELPTSGDPMLAYTTGPQQVLAQVYETLVAISQDGHDLEPGLADSWTANSDGTRWTFRLGGDAVFTDGTPVTAEVVCANFDAWSKIPADLQADATIWSAYFGGFADDASSMTYRTCRAEDDTTLELELSRPLGFLPDVVALPNFGIRAQSMLDEGADAEPVGSGPFTWERGDADRVLLEAADSRAGVASLEFVVAADSTQVASGQLDIAGPLPAGDDGSGEQTALSAPSLMTMMWVNATKGRPLADPALREAVDLSIDRQALAELADEGSEPTGDLVPPMATTSGTADPATGQDLVRAKQLVGSKKATLTLLGRDYGQRAPVQRQMNDLIKGWLEQAGFTVKIRNVTSASEYFAIFDNGTVSDLGTIGFLPYTADPVDFLRSILPSLDTVEGVVGAQWRTDLDDLLIDALDTVDTTDRRDMAAEVEATYLQRRITLPLYSTPDRYAVGAGIDGFEPGPISVESLAGVTVN
ncbi:ABC transporter substrate-binding protein [Nakamurella alba]|nr:ABC transporter substrate-binding protein [Nakamurella alba]